MCLSKITASVLSHYTFLSHCYCNPSIRVTLTSTQPRSIRITCKIAVLSHAFLLLILRYCLHKLEKMI